MYRFLIIAFPSVLIEILSTTMTNRFYKKKKKKKKKKKTLCAIIKLTILKIAECFRGKFLHRAFYCIPTKKNSIARTLVHRMPCCTKLPVVTDLTLTQVCSFYDCFIVVPVCLSLWCLGLNVNLIVSFPEFSYIL